MAISFMQGRKAETPPKNSSASTGDLLAPAKAKIIEALNVQKGYARLMLEGKDLPRRQGSRSFSTWFYRRPDGSYGTTIRYGQVAIPIEGEDIGIPVGRLDELPAFYDMVALSPSKRANWTSRSGRYSRRIRRPGRQPIQSSDA
jgi:hypothetical protein